MDIKESNTERKRKRDEEGNGEEEDDAWKHDRSRRYIFTRMLWAAARSYIHMPHTHARKRELSLLIGSARRYGKFHTFH